ncbi:MAG: hypothetical protein A2234_05640 [Elusimicrobia bacterium RIFOXYA2_FULL_58_8]|nr:MAG: hypothetical protein A2285_02975 [Elusimicrobia bacterium RIFOXYA12_FULL_57_11]OGS13790.1 MAG: hypothetical protein A2234_05640 [Elusimicrobia bacterium RIFOXYA2_FULL_58_8]
MGITEKNRVLIISGNKDLIRLLHDSASRGGYAVDTLSTGAQAFTYIISCKPKLIFLDAGAGEVEGVTWIVMLREMTGAENIPVIVFGERLRPETIAGFFDAGADDCILLRDCDQLELSARIRAVLRRHSAREAQKMIPLRCGPVELDLACHRCFAEGREVNLRPREFELLEILMRKEGRVLGRAYLLECVWGMSSAASTRAVDVTVSRLRKALGEKVSCWIGGVNKMGYRFSAPDKVPR